VASAVGTGRARVSGTLKYSHPKGYEIAAVRNATLFRTLG
jgi:hypothetical protein